jgi:hypothetical protein
MYYRFGLICSSYTEDSSFYSNRKREFGAGLPSLYIHIQIHQLSRLHQLRMLVLRLTLFWLVSFIISLVRFGN